VFLKVSGLRNPLSVIMLTYNREKWVGRAIESILNQTFRDFELILVDNDSQDRSGDICHGYAKRDRRVIVLHRDNGNIGAGRNLGLDHASGEYVAFIDDDDIAHPDMLEFLINLAVEYDTDISFCGSDKTVMQYGKETVLPNCVFGYKKVFTPEEAVIELCERKKLNASTPTKLFRKKLFGSLRFSENRVHDDTSLTYKLFATANKAVGHGVSKYVFTRHLGNSSIWTDHVELLPRELDEYFEVYRERTIWLKKHLPKISEYAEYSEWSFLISMYDKITRNHFDSICEAQKAYAWDYLSHAGQKFETCEWIKDFELAWMELYGLRDEIQAI
jgi:glycosyltransferase involved in cell wall biosynthesis